MKTSRPIYMPELAQLLWPDTYDLSKPDERHTASQRARRFLRRLEHQRNKPPLLYRDGDGRRYYTTLQLLKRHAKELVDLQALIEQLCVERDHRMRAHVRGLKKAQGALAARQRDVAERQRETHRLCSTALAGLEGRVKALEDRLHKMFPRVF